MEFKSSIMFRPLQFSGVGVETPTYICFLPIKLLNKIQQQTWVRLLCIKFNIENGPGGSRTHGRRGLGNRRSILLSYRPLILFNYHANGSATSTCSYRSRDTTPLTPLRRAFALLASRSPRGTELQTLSSG